MTAETKSVSLLVLLIVAAVAVVVWADYSALTDLFDRVGRSLAAIPAGQR